MSCYLCGKDAIEIVIEDEKEKPVCESHYWAIIDYIEEENNG